MDRSILDTAIGDVKDLHRTLRRGDQRRLDHYLESIREVEKRLDDKKVILRRGRPRFDEKAVRTEAQSKDGFQEHIELMMDLIALAFSLGGDGGPNYDEYKDQATQAEAPTRGAHDYHHKGSGKRGKDSADVKVIDYRDEVFCACLAHPMDRLNAVEASEGPLLDHAVLLLGGSQISSDSGSNFPLLLACGNKLGFRHDQHLKWEGEKRTASDLYLTMLQQFGCPVKSLKESKGSISEILV